MRKFKLGDTVRIKYDLEINKYYYSEDGEKGDYVTPEMSQKSGQEGVIIQITYLGYKLDIDAFSTYTAEMLEIPSDDLAVSDYILNIDVERALAQADFTSLKKRIDKALDEKLFQNDKEAFDKLMSDYQDFIKKNRNILF